MVVVVIIGLLAAMSLPIYRHITMRSKTVAVQNDFRTFSTAFVTYNLQHGGWPADSTAAEIPTEMTGALPPGFTTKTPIGGFYKWEAGHTIAGVDVKAAISIVGASDDQDLLEMIDREMDDGDLANGNVKTDGGNTLVFIIEK